jgi:hypothetical protein
MNIGSSPVAGMLRKNKCYSGCGLVVKVSALEAEDRRFESCHPDLYKALLYHLVLSFRKEQRNLKNFVSD